MESAGKKEIAMMVPSVTPKTHIPTNLGGRSGLAA
jgi:hypothetical protein